MADLLSFAAIGLLAFLGWGAGTKVMALRTAGWAAAYGVALLLAAPLGGILESAVGLQPLLALPVAGGFVFVGVKLAFQLGARKAKKDREKRLKEGWTPPLLDYWGGAGLGALWGAGGVLVVVWSLLWFHGASGRGPDLSGSLVGLAGAALGRPVADYTMAKAAGSPALGELLGSVAANPRKVMPALDRLIRDDRVIASLLDGGGSMDWAQDPELARAAREAGLANGSSAAEVGREVVAKLAPIARAASSLKDDPRLKDLMADARVREALQRQDISSLLVEPRVTGLLKELRARLAETSSDAEKPLE